MPTMFYEESDIIIDKISSCIEVYYLHASEDRNGILFKSGFTVYEMLRTRLVISIENTPIHEMEAWSFIDISRKENSMITPEYVNKILAFIEDKFGISIDELSLGNLSY